MPATPSEIKEIKEEVRLIKDEDLQSSKDQLLLSFRQQFNSGKLSDLTKINKLPLPPLPIRKSSSK